MPQCLFIKSGTLSYTFFIKLVGPTLLSRIWVYFGKYKLERPNYVTDVYENVVMSSGVTDESVMGKTLKSGCTGTMSSCAASFYTHGNSFGGKVLLSSRTRQWRG